MPQKGGGAVASESSLELRPKNGGGRITATPETPELRARHAARGGASADETKQLLGLNTSV